MSDKPASLGALLQVEIPRLYAFAYHMTGTRDDARGHVRQLVKAVKVRHESKVMGADNASDTILGLLAQQMEESLGRRSEFTFEGLDNVLRSDITRPIDLASGVGGLGNDPTKVHVMLWELKRTCLTATLCCLPPGVRVSFVLTDLFGYSPAEAAALLDIKESAYRVRLTRARKRVEDYLAPRCVHVDQKNPCNCTGRLIIAMDANFVKEPPHHNDIPHEAHDGDGPRRDMGSLYRGLPQVKLTTDELTGLVNT